MAQHASAEKRNRQNTKRRARNTALRSQMRSAEKSARAALTTKTETRAADVKAAVANINRAATKQVISKATASRHVSRLMRAAAKAS